MGLSLGLIGGGGSILTVPILVYLFDVPPIQATGESLFIVGFTSLAGAALNASSGRVSFRVVAVFAPPAMLTVYAVRRWLIPVLPQVFTVGTGFSIPRDAALMLGFALVMAVAAVAMIHRSVEPSASSPHAVQLAALGVLVGLLAGLFGAGGGFLIVPALALLAALPMPRAVGTSLAIIAVQSLVGFVGVTQSAVPVDWGLLGVLTSLALTGMAVGVLVGHRVASGTQLKAAFGWFVLAMSLVIAWRELSTWLT